MVYIETIKRGKKNYYYLTKNIRVTKDKWKNGLGKIRMLDARSDY